MRLLVTGAGGMLGADVLRAADAAGAQAVGLARAELDVTRREDVRDALEDERPDAVINCAAYTDVDGAETEFELADVVNGAGAAHVAAAAAGVGARMIQVSTDYVFDGTARAPYVESDATGPLSAYGRSKLLGEEAVLGAHPGPLIVRSSWLFGVDGRNFVDTMLRLGRERDQVSVVYDQTGCPTWTGHLAPALVALAASPAAGICHVAGAGSCSWHALAVETFRLAGLACRVRPITSAAFGARAPRPGRAVLNTERPDVPILAAWNEGLRGFLAARGALVESVAG